MVKPQDSGQPPPGSIGDPNAHRNEAEHPGTHKRKPPGPAQAPAEGNDPSLTGGKSRVRTPRAR